MKILPPNRSVGLGLVFRSLTVNVILLKETLSIHHSVGSNKILKQEYTYKPNTHAVQSGCGGLVLGTSAARLRKDELTCDSEGGNESEIYKDCDVIAPTGTFSPSLSVIN